MDVKQYLAPLTNNERGVLLYAAGLRYRIERSSSVESDVANRYDSGTRKSIPSSQLDKAIMGLVEKGYAEIKPKRGNYYRYYYGYRRPLRRDGAPYHKIVSEKQRGSTRWMNINWHSVVDVVPTGDVKAMMDEYREAAKKEADRLADIQREKVPTMQAEKERKLLNLCRQYVEKYGNGETVIHKHEKYDWYEVANIVDEIQDATRALDRWTSERRRIEEA